VDGDILKDDFIASLAYQRECLKAQNVRARWGVGSRKVILVRFEMPTLKEGFYDIIVVDPTETLNRPQLLL